ncbi:hypothetical protein CPB84DRAFT_1786333 [Gymnopilus junonius]|uniref:Endoplasmic reticulum junction formation protein lunapark n=1 Tax=Gymnopilus junonius TaxID=109634 RepID=A0A9P5TKC2_GYMJU|nr:hypothetical protein CPB84DRAFT_1786333 [Gymnopilus junonius]
MSFLRRIFGKKNDEDYETILSNLANDIQKRQTRLSEIRLRERRSSLLATLYTLAIWVAYVSLWYLNALPNLHDGTYIKHQSTDKFLKGFPVVIGPIIILFIRRVVQIWYKRKGDAEEKHLKELMKKRRDKVEEIKKKTNYYTTRDLLQKYDEAVPPPALLRQRIPPGQALPSTPGRMAPPANGNAQPQTPAPSAALQAHLSPGTPAYPIAPPRRQWYDKLADALLGEDDPSIASPGSRYALICEKCFNHNGLVKESMWEETQYVCPKCGHFNASVKSKRERALRSATPSTSTASSPSHPATIASPSQAPLQATSLSVLSRSTPSELEKDLPSVDAENDSTAMEVDSEDEHEES